MIPVEQGVEYYHVHTCACGWEVFHDGASNVCEQSYMPFQCADCRPYVHEDLLMSAPPMSKSAVEIAVICLFNFACGFAVAWLIFH